MPAKAEDKPGTQPHFLFSRMGGYDIGGMERKKFGRHTFMIDKNSETGEVSRKTVDGSYLQVSYLRQGGLEANSTLFVAANHENAIKALGGEVIYKQESGDDVTFVVFKVDKDGKNVWGELDLTAGGNDFRITTVSEGAMEQEVTAQLIESTVRDTGRFAVYGIEFDTNKSTIRPESAETIAQVAEMLRSSGIRAYIVGHTDNVGEFASNQLLSEQRAQSVVRELTSKHGIPAARLIAKGVGQLAPVASNSSEENRQKNRRVEVVAQ